MNGQANFLRSVSSIVDDSAYFITEWIVSAGDTIKFPSNAAIALIPNYTIDWDDGTEIQIVDEYTDVNLSHTYVAGGVYNPKILGHHPYLANWDAINRPLFSKVIQWGTSEVTLLNFVAFKPNFIDVSSIDQPNFVSSFSLANLVYLCSNFDSPNVSNWNIAGCNNMANSFRDAAIFNQPLNWDTSLVANMSYCFYNAKKFNQPLNWDTSLVTTFQRFLYQASDFDQDLSGFNVGNVTNASQMLDGTNMSVANMDKLFISWGGQVLKPGVTFGCAGLQFTLGGAAEAGYNSMIAQGWDIVGATGI